MTAEVVTIRMSAADAERLVEVSMAWGADWRGHDGRFEQLDGSPTAPPSYAWAWAYWLGESWASALLFRSYLDTVGATCEVLWDLAEQEAGGMLGWVVLTDWASPTWATPSEPRGT